MEQLIEDLKNYEKQGLSLQEADVKMYKEKELPLRTIIKKLDAKTLPELITKLEEPTKQLKAAVDGFVDDLNQQEKNIQKL